jgi:hypothetical protein
MASSDNPDNSGSTWSCDSSEVITTKLFQPNGDVALTEYDSFALTEAEVAAILIKEK